jgi:hypothetical protein
MGVSKELLKIKLVTCSNKTEIKQQKPIDETRCSFGKILLWVKLPILKEMSAIERETWTAKTNTSMLH